MKRPAASASRPRALWVGLAVLALLALAGCSGSAPEQPGGAGGASEGAAVPKPRGSVDDVARELSAVVEAKDCAGLRRLSFAGIPKTDGADCEKLLDQFDGLKPGKSAQYRTAAVVDFTTAEKPLTLTFLTDRAGDFRWALRVARGENEEIAGTQPPAGNSLDATAASATEALRTGDCEALLAPARGVVPQPAQVVKGCQGRVGMRKKLEGDAGARPELLGANSRVAFYSLNPSPGGPYDTLVILQRGKRSAFARDFPLAAAAKKN